MSEQYGPLADWDEQAANQAVAQQMNNAGNITAWLGGRADIWDSAILPDGSFVEAAGGPVFSRTESEDGELAPPHLEFSVIHRLRKFDRLGMLSRTYEVQLWDTDTATAVASAIYDPRIRPLAEEMSPEQAAFDKQIASSMHSRKLMFLPDYASRILERVISEHSE